MVKSNESGLMLELQRLLADGWGKVFDSEHENLGAWFRFQPKAQSANDADFIQLVKTERTRAKKSAKTPKTLAIFRSWCQNVLTGKNGVVARRYWGSGPFTPVGPGVKTLTPPQ